MTEIILFKKNHRIHFSHSKSLQIRNTKHEHKQHGVDYKMTTWLQWSIYILVRDREVVVIDGV